MWVLPPEVQGLKHTRQCGWNSRTHGRAIECAEQDLFLVAWKLKALTEVNIVLLRSNRRIT